MVIPVHDTNPLRRTPLVTYTLVAANVVVLVLFTPGAIPGVGSQAAVACQQAAFYDHYGAIPRALISGHQLSRAVPTGQVVQTASGPGCQAAPPAYHMSPLLSVLTAMFVHSGWLHLLGNMLFLAIFGNNVEDRMRKLPFLLFYLAAGYVAAFGFAAAFPSSTEPLVGASGAIAGVLGAYLVLFPRAKVWSLVPFLFFIPLRIPAWLVLGLWFVLEWFYSVGQSAPGGGAVAYVAHVFGFVFGVLVGLVARALTPDWQAPVRVRAR